MGNDLYLAISILLSVLVLIGIYLMSKVKTARTGNLLSVAMMTFAIVITLYSLYQNGSIINPKEALIISFGSLLVGSIIGLILAIRVKMIQMPEMVALLNGVGGAASAIVGGATISQPGANLFVQVTGVLALIIGMITLTGSIIAALKLAKLIKGKPVILPMHDVWSYLFLGLTIVTTILMFIPAFNSYLLLLVILTTIFSGTFGVIFTIRVGGADMPITISLLNSLSGVAGAIAGMAIYDTLLVAVGGIVGSSGLVLTQIMCQAMNRSLMEILLGKTTLAKPKHTEDTKVKVVEEVKTTPKTEVVDNKTIINQAKDVIIVPGYGMALAQAQHMVKDLTQALMNKGARVRFAIHPVAGRMPGHMNVLLAEADIDYEQLYEMDAINDDFKIADVCIVIGANDVINPAARNTPNTPIYGMPILNVDDCKHIFILNYDKRPGYAGVDNPLYSKDHGVTLLLGDAKETIQQLLDLLK